MVLGIDVGGYDVLAVLVKDWKVVKRKRYKIKSKSRDEIIGIVLELIEEFKPKYVGIGVPGIIENGKVIFSANIPSLNGFHIANFIERKTGTKVKIENDVNCFALGEYFRRKKDLVGITIGTGLGGGIIINGKIYHGRRDAGEFGHMTIIAKGRKCSCGNRGCLEEYVSERAFKREAKKVFGKKMTPKEIYFLAKKGNRKAKQIFENIGRFLGVGLANIANVLNPELIVIGGGISKAGKLLLEPARKEMKKRLVVSQPKIVLGREDSAAFGAAILWR